MTHFQQYQKGIYPGDELTNEIEQAPIQTKLKAIVVHKATACQFTGQRYAIGPDLEESARIEIGDILFRYILSDSSTKNGDANACFRHINGMDAAIRVAPAGIARVDFLPKKTTSDGLNATSIIDIQIGGYGTGVYTGSRDIRKHSYVMTQQMGPEYYTGTETLRRLQKGHNAAVIQPRMVPMDSIRAHNSMPMTDIVLDHLRRTLVEMTTEQDGMLVGATPRDIQDLTNRQTEENRLPNSCTLRRHLALAGYEGAQYTDERGIENPPVVPPPANQQPLGMEFILELDEYFMGIWNNGKKVEDPMSALTECFTLWYYLTDLIMNGRVHVDKKARTNTEWLMHVNFSFMRIFGYTIEHELYHREFCLFGRVYRDAKPDSINIPYIIMP